MGVRFGATDWRSPKLPPAFLWVEVSVRVVIAEREPSSARSASDCTTSAEQIWPSPRVGGCCEPRTARGPPPILQLYPAAVLSGVERFYGIANSVFHRRDLIACLRFARERRRSSNAITNNIASNKSSQKLLFTSPSVTPANPGLRAATVGSSVLRLGVSGWFGTFVETVLVFNFPKYSGEFSVETVDASPAAVAMRPEPVA